MTVRRDVAFVGRYLGPQKYLALALGCTLLSVTGLSLYSPRLLKGFLDSATEHRPVRELIWIATHYCVVNVCQSVLRVLATYLGTRMSAASTNALREDLVDHCLRLDMHFHLRHTPGEMIERLDGDISTLNEVFSTFFMQIASNVLLLGGLLVLVCIEDWRAGLALSVCSLCTLAIANRLRSKGQGHQRAFLEASGDFFGYVEERIAATDNIAPLGATWATVHGFLTKSFVLFRACLSAQLSMNVTLNTVWLVFYIANAAALGIGGYLFLDGYLTLGSVYLMHAYVSMTRRPVEGLVAQMENVLRALASIERLHELLDCKSRVVDGQGDELPDGALAVSFDGVVFRYDERAIALQNVSFQLRPGERLGVVGRTGSGKSTIARLLFRLYDPDSGEIRLSRIRLSDSKLRNLRRRIGVVPQTPQLFEGTIRDNLTLLDRSVPDAKLNTILESLGMEAWMARQEDGLDTVLGADGTGLSAGEAQLLVLARVFIADVGLIILDEPSAMLDDGTATLFYRALDTLLESRTSIVIAHRLETLDRVDKILLLEDGRVVEFGPRESLAADPRSRFFELLTRRQSRALA